MYRSYMIFVSQLLGSEVTDNADQQVGRVSDVVVRDLGLPYPVVVLVEVRTSGKAGQVFLPASYIEIWGREITLAQVKSKLLFEKSEPQDIFLKRDILDMQIVDVEGIRVVRVNDLKLAVIEGRLSVVGIDVSTRGLLRRLGVPLWGPLKRLDEQLVDWKNVHVVGGKSQYLQLKTSFKDIQKLHAADLAHILEELSVKQRTEFVQSLDQVTAARVLESLDPDVKKVLVQALGPERAAAIVSEMSLDELVDLLKDLPKHQAKEVLSYFQQGKLQIVQKYLTYHSESAGGLMTGEFVSVRPTWTVGQTMEYVKQVSQRFRSILYVYVTEEDGKFVGVISIRKLLVADSTMTVQRMMGKPKKTQVVFVRQTKEEVAQLMTKYHLLCVAVLDKEKHLVGIITADDVMRSMLVG